MVHLLQQRMADGDWKDVPVSEFWNDCDDVTDSLRGAGMPGKFRLITDTLEDGVCYDYFQIVATTEHVAIKWEPDES